MDDPFDALFRRGRSLRFAPDADTNGVAGYEGLVGNDQIQPAGWVIGNLMNLDTGATVVIDSIGITIENGALILKDRFGATVMRAIGFDGAWNRYIQSGFYNSGFTVGDTVDIAVTQVGTGSTVADYEAGLTVHLPYWVVAASGGTVRRIADAGASEGAAIEFSGTGGQTNRIYQDIPVPALRKSWSIFVNYSGNDFFSASDAIRFYGSWRAADHSIVGSRVAITNIPGPGGAGGPAYGTLFTETNGGGDFGPGVGSGIGDAPGNAAYLRFEIEIVHQTATFVIRISDVYSYGGTFDGALVVADNAQFGDTVVQGDLQVSGLLQTSGGVPYMTPTGSIIMYGGLVAPNGYLLCNGASYLRTDYADLFAIISAQYGAADGTHFNVPDLRQRFPLGKAAAGTGSVMGATGGAIDHVHTGPSHTHTGPSHTHTGPSHTHTGPSHSHTMASHTHSTAVHNHTLTGTNAWARIAIGLAAGVDFWIEHLGSKPAWTATHKETFTNHAADGVTSKSSGASLDGSTENNPGGQATGTPSNNTSDAAGTGATGADGTGATGAAGTGATGADGTGNTGSNNPPYQVVNFIIKT